MNKKINIQRPLGWIITLLGLFTIVNRVIEGTFLTDISTLDGFARTFMFFIIGGVTLYLEYTKKPR